LQLTCECKHSQAQQPSEFGGLLPSLVNPGLVALAFTQVRILDITISLGVFAGQLWIDKVTGQEDEPSIVRKRAAHLR